VNQGYFTSGIPPTYQDGFYK